MEASPAKLPDEPYHTARDVEGERHIHLRNHEPDYKNYRQRRTSKPATTGCSPVAEGRPGQLAVSAGFQPRTAHVPTPSGFSTAAR